MTAKSLLRLPAVQARSALSRSTIYQRVLEGTFPKPVKIGPRAIAWTEESIDRWIDQCIQQATYRATPRKSGSRNKPGGGA